MITKHLIDDEYNEGDPYDVDLNNYFHSERLKNTLTLLNKVTCNSKVLDIGCGKGIITKNLTINGNEVLGIDYSSNAIAYANQHFANALLTFRVLDISELKHLNKKFDTIVANNLIEHIDGINQFFVDCYDLLEQKGYLIISTPNLYSFKNIITAMFWNKLEYRHHNHICEYTLHQIQHFVLNVGFSLVKIIPQYQIKSETGLKYWGFNVTQRFFKLLKLSFFASTYFYLLRK